ncbi:hypothetical protein K439DRAFT_1636008 [Ramaria rubella]|nr:hypothetical protein K439DRAFT_1636008 [Ramaria rubella]
MLPRRGAHVLIAAATVRSLFGCAAITERVKYAAEVARWLPECAQPYWRVGYTYNGLPCVDVCAHLRHARVPSSEHPTCGGGSGAEIGSAGTLRLRLRLTQ